MAARVLGEFCIQCGLKSLQRKSMTSDPLRASLPEFSSLLASQAAQ